MRDLIMFRRIHKKGDEVKVSCWGYVEGSFDLPQFISGWDFVCDEQFTGMIDCKGKRIFEGDIVVVKSSGWHKDSDYYNVVFTDYSYLLENAAGYGDEFGVYKRKFGLRKDAYEVVGNIHEKIELLKTN